MNKIGVVLLGILPIFLICCSGSETYRGTWKATDSNGEKFEIIFEAKNVTIIDSSGQSKKFEYSQNSVNIENSVSTYGIAIGDGRKYKITFPYADKKDIGIIKDENNNPVYTIGREDYFVYEDVFKLNE